VSASTNLLKRYVKDLDQTEDELLEARKLCRAVDQTMTGLNKQVAKLKQALAQLSSQWEIKLA
jgi:predicted  nucleic acid-binding Zn-ribbon protein